uniref:Uncharacterized protein n=1 Tax=Leptocylindrus danicus TaxID=163516 RepID=A0A7S2JVV1_9STRA|mmetsp:Transcript_12728/g.19101  ORF Transcript_12728/g.19101 Transcript_12728/m.19101 type:complete len:263 (+) Transcript_12728:218-1006(+)
MVGLNFDSRISSAIDLLNQVLSEATASRKNAIDDIERITNRYSNEIEILELTLARLPPSYEELSRIRSEDRNKHKGDHDADCAYDDEEDANHALNFHLNRNNLQTPASDIFILPDDSDDDLSEDLSQVAVEDNCDDGSVMSMASNGQQGESEDIRTWKEYKKYSLREHFFEQMQEMKDSKDLFRDHFHDRDMKAIFSSGYSIRDLEKQQMKQSKKMRSCLKEYVPKLKFRRNGGWNKDESLKLGLNVMPVGDLLRNIYDETE